MEIDWTQIVLWVIAVAAVGLGVWNKFASGTPVSVSTDSIKDAMQVAQDTVAAAEQLWQSGQIKKDDRFMWALEQLQALYPGLTAEALELTIEAAVYWLKQGVAKLEVEATVEE